MKNMDEPVVEVNDKKITLGEIEQRLRTLAPAVRIRIRKNKQQFLDGLVQGELLYQEALRRKIDESPQIQKRVERLMRRLVIEEFLKQDLGRPARPGNNCGISFSRTRGGFAARKRSPSPTSCSKPNKRRGTP